MCSVQTKCAQYMSGVFGTDNVCSVHVVCDQYRQGVFSTGRVCSVQTNCVQYGAGVFGKSAVRAANVAQASNFPESGCAHKHTDGNKTTGKKKKII